MEDKRFERAMAYSLFVGVGITTVVATLLLRYLPGGMYAPGGIWAVWYPLQLGASALLVVSSFYGRMFFLATSLILVFQRRRKFGAVLVLAFVSFLWGLMKTFSQLEAAPAVTARGDQFGAYFAVLLAVAALIVFGLCLRDLAYINQRYQSRG